MEIEKKNNTIIYSTLGSKDILEYLKVIERNKEYLKDYENAIEKFNSAFWFSSAYLGMLKRAKIISPSKNAIGFSPVIDNSSVRQAIFINGKDVPELYLEVVTKDSKLELGLALDFENAKEYSLIISGTGRTSLVLSYDNSKPCVLDDYSECNSLTIILPFLFSGLLNNSNYASQIRMLNAIAKKNPMSTISNIYTYVKNNMQEIKELPDKIRELKSIIEEITKSEKENNMTRSYFEYWKGKKFGSGEKIHLPPYYIDKQKDNLAIKIEYVKEDIMKYNYKNYEECYPSYIQIQDNEFKPYFLQNKFYTDEKLVKKMKEKLYSFKDNKGLITLEEKIDELCVFEKEKIKKNEDWHDGGFKEYGHIINTKENNGKEAPLDEEKEIKKFRKEITKLLNKNTNYVLSMLEKHISNAFKKGTLEEQEEYLVKLNDKVSKFIKISEDISAMFGRMYKNEILLENL